MQRRKFLATVGSLAAGSAAVIGTGAFDRVTATRGVTVETTGDLSAALRLRPTSPYSELNSENMLVLRLDELNANSDIEINDLFTIQNQGSQPVGIFIDDNAYVFRTGTAEAPSAVGSDGLNAVLRANGLNQNGFFDDDITTGEDINGPGALPSAYRPGGSNTIDKPWDPAANDHIIGVGKTLQPDWYLFDTPANDDFDVNAKVAIWAYSKEFAQNGKGP